MDPMFGQCGQSVLFGQPSDDLQTNIQHYTNAQQYAQAHPGNLRAQRQLAYWTEVVNRQMQAAAAAFPAQPAVAPAAPAQPAAASPATPSFTVPLQGVANPQAHAGFH